MSGPGLLPSCAKTAVNIALEIKQTNNLTNAMN